MLDRELPDLTRDALSSSLAPGSGGSSRPGTGLFSVPVVRRLGPDGVLDVFDIQQEMLDHTLRVARNAGLGNVIATAGDARRLPYRSGAFQVAFVMTALGEIRDRDAALAELRRVLAPGGRLVVGEFLVDWHAVRLGALRRRAERHDLHFERRPGPRWAYLARLRAGR